MTYQRRRKRTADELVGLCRGLIADGVINDQEVLFLELWLRANDEFRHEYPFNTLYDRVEDALADGVIDPDEERDLLAAIHGLAGNVMPAPTHEEGKVRGVSTSARLPLCEPPPPVRFDGQVFVVTGVCSYGPRAAVADAIAQRGGLLKSNISRKVGFLVIGDVGSRDWLHSSYGTKIEAAVTLREDGLPIRIVSEDHWRAHL